MKLIFLICFICFTGFAVENSQAQLKRNYFKTIEFYTGTGGTLYFGDVGGRDLKIKGFQALFDNLDIDLFRSRPMLHTGLRFNLLQSFAGSLELTPMWLSGSDLHSDKSDRNFSFDTFATEISARGEFYFKNRLTSFSPYLLAGGGEIFYSFKPGTDTHFSKIYYTSTLILGAGMHFPPTKGISHSVEFAYHFAYTDILDGYKAIGSNKDLFFIAAYKINFEIYTQPGR